MLLDRVHCQCANELRLLALSELQLQLIPYEASPKTIWNLLGIIVCNQIDGHFVCSQIDATGLRACTFFLQYAPTTLPCFQIRFRNLGKRRCVRPGQSGRPNESLHVHVGTSPASSPSVHNHQLHHEGTQRKTLQRKKGYTQKRILTTECFKLLTAQARWAENHPTCRPNCVGSLINAAVESCCVNCGCSDCANCACSNCANCGGPSGLGNKPVFD